MIFNKNFFHLALGFMFVLGVSLFFVFGIGFYESEIKNQANVVDYDREHFPQKQSVFLNQKTIPTDEWPPKPI